MNSVGNIICLNEVVYSRELFLSYLCFKFYKDRMDSDVNKFADDELLLYGAISTGVLNLTKEKPYLVNTNMRTKVLTRLDDKIFDLDNDMLDILLKYSDEESVSIDISRMVSLLDTCKIVYNDKDKIESLMFYLLRIESRVPADRIMKYADFTKYLEENKCSVDENKEIIIISDAKLIKKYVNYYRFVVPINLALCNIHGIYGTVNCWDFK